MQNPDVLQLFCITLFFRHMSRLSSESVSCCCCCHIVGHKQELHHLQLLHRVCSAPAPLRVSLRYVSATCKHTNPAPSDETMPSPTLRSLLRPLTPSSHDLVSFMSDQRIVVSFILQTCCTGGRHHRAAAARV